MSRILKLLAWFGRFVFRLLLVLLIVLPFAFYLRPLQEYAAQGAAKYLSEKLNCRLEIGALYLSPLGQLKAHDIYLEDLNCDTLCYVHHLSVPIKGISKDGTIMYFGDVVLDGVDFRLFANHDGGLNLDFLLESEPEVDSTAQTEGRSLQIKFLGIELRKTKFAYYYEKQRGYDGIINWDDLRVSDIELKATGVTIDSDTAIFNMEHLSFKEHAGFVVDKMTAKGQIGAYDLILDKLTMFTGASEMYFEPCELHWHHFTNDFYNYTQNVVMSGELVAPSTIRLSDLAYFTYSLDHFEDTVSAIASFYGTVHNLYVDRFKADAYGATELDCDFKMIDWYFTLDVDRLYTTPSDLARFRLWYDEPIVPKSKTLDAIEEIGFSGLISGYPDDISIGGHLTSPLGMVYLDLALKHDDALDGDRILGAFETINLNPRGLWPGSEQFGVLNIGGQLTGSYSKTGSYKAHAVLGVNKLLYRGYRYQHAQANINLVNDSVDVDLQLTDPNLTAKLKLSANSFLDHPQASLRFNLDTCLPGRLHLVTDTSFRISANVQVDMEGARLDSVRGDMVLRDLAIANSKAHFALDSMGISVKKVLGWHGECETQVSVRGPDVSMDANLGGKPTALARSVRYLLHKSLPTVMPRPAGVKATDTCKSVLSADYTLLLDARLPQDLSRSLGSGVWFDSTLRVAVNYNSVTQNLDVAGNLSQFHSGKTTSNGLHFLLRADTATAKVNMSIDEMAIRPKLSLHQVVLDNVLQHNKVKSVLNWGGEGISGQSGQLSTRLSFEKDSGSVYTTLDIEPSRIKVDETVWSINRSSIGLVDSTIRVQNFLLDNMDQSIYIDGVVSSSVNDTLTLGVQHVDLSYLNSFTEEFGLHFNGRLFAQAQIASASDKPLFDADLLLDQLQVNKLELGVANLSVKGQKGKAVMDVGFNIDKYGKELLSLNGFYDTKELKVGVVLGLDSFPLALAAPFLGNYASGLAGYAFANDLRAEGSLLQPNVQGNLFLDDVSFFIDYLGMAYRFSAPINFQSGSIGFSQLQVQDTRGQSAWCSGLLNYGVNTETALKLSVELDALQVLNTKAKDNSSFYGKAFLSGLVHAYGPLNKLVFDIDATTKPHTRVAIPIEEQVDFAVNEFIRFVQPEQEQETEQVVPPGFGGFSINCGLNITPDAEVQVVFDSSTGDVLRTRGRAALNLKLGVGGDLEMAGEYVIDQGAYMFTLQEVINKRFSLVQGGSITWNGEPYDAKINIAAKYLVNRANLYDLLGEELYDLVPGSEKKGIRVPVDCYLYLKNRLLSPVITFEIDLPNTRAADEIITTRLKNLSEEELNKQFLSLLVMSRFQPLVNRVEADELRGSQVATSATELLSGKLNNWLSQISDDFDIGVNYQTGDSISSREIEVAMSTQLWNNRLSINSNLGYSEDKATTSDLVGDFEMELKLNNSGKVRMKAFTYSNENQIVNDSPYTQGVGLFYREDFNTFSELGKKIKTWFMLARKQENDTLKLDMQN